MREDVKILNQFTGKFASGPRDENPNSELSKASAKLEMSYSNVTTLSGDEGVMD